MSRRISLLLAATALLASAANLSADEKRYDLSKKHVYRVGDVAVHKGVGSHRLSMLDADGKIYKDTTIRLQNHCRYEVLEVDKAGAIQAFRLTIVSAKAHYEAGKVKKDVSLEKVHFTARRDGMAFKADTKTIVSEKHSQLRASQIALLKNSCTGRIYFAGCDEPDMFLMPADSIPVGHTWQITPEKLKQWQQITGRDKANWARNVSGQFKLVSVTDGIALVEGTMMLGDASGNRKLDMPAEMTMKIDTESGRRVGGLATIDHKVSREGRTAKVDARKNETITFTPGKGTASALPAKVFKLGWQPPEKDTNNQIHKQLGLSLNVPEGYVIQEPPPQGNVVLVFVGPRGGANIRVTASDLPVPIDLADLIRAYEKRSIEIVSKKRFSLPGNVPAVVIEGKVQRGQVEATTLTVMAIDGGRVVSVSAAAQSKDKESLAELRAAVKSLRLFEPVKDKAK